MSNIIIEPLETQAKSSILACACIRTGLIDIKLCRYHAALQAQLDHNRSCRGGSECLDRSDCLGYDDVEPISDDE
jgi:hypothetical protein